MSTMSTWPEIGPIFSILSFAYVTRSNICMKSSQICGIELRAQRVCVAVCMWTIITYGIAIPGYIGKWESK